MVQEGVLDPRAAGAHRFIEKVCIVTGAGQGIGRATARRLGQEGGTIVVADLNPVGAERVVNELQEAGVDALAFIGDVTDVKVAQELMAFTVRERGRIDVLVNVVGGTYNGKPFEEYTIEEVEQEIARSLWSAIWCCHSVLPYMLERRSGAIVNLSSHSVVSVDRVPYAAAKGGVVALTTSLSKEVADKGIRINCTAPHATVGGDRIVPRNPAREAAVAAMSAEERAEHEKRLDERRRREIPMGRTAIPAEQASAIAFLASDDASFITGQVLPVGGGATYR